MIVYLHFPPLYSELVARSRNFPCQVRISATSAGKGCRLCRPGTVGASDEAQLASVRPKPCDSRHAPAVCSLYEKITLLVTRKLTQRIELVDRYLDCGKVRNKIQNKEFHFSLHKKHLTSRNYLYNKEPTSFIWGFPEPKPNINICPCESEAAIMFPHGDHLASNTAP